MHKADRSFLWVRIIFLATTIFLVVLSIYSFLEIKKLVNSSDWVNHTNQVKMSLQRISTALIEAETNQKNFLLTGDSSCLVKRDVVFDLLSAELKLVDSLTSDNPEQGKILKKVHTTIDEKLVSMKKVLKGYTPLNMHTEFKMNIAEGVEKTKNFTEAINEMSRNETYLLQQRTKQYTDLASATPLAVIILFLGALLILLVSYFKVNNALHQAKQSEKIANENDARFKETVVSKKLLEDSEARYHRLIYSSPSAIGILYGEDMVITIANDAIIEIWGKGKEIVGKKYFEALPELEEQGYKEVFTQVYKTGIPYNAIETPLQLLQNGKMELKYYNFILYPQRNINNQIDGIGIIATEVTSQALLNNKVKESEQKFRLLADSMPQHIWTADTQGNLNYFNKSVFTYSGLNAEQINKDGWLQIVHPDDREANVSAWTNAITTGDPFLFEHRFRKHTGEYRWQLSRALPQKDEQGKIQMWVGTSTDIQDQKSFTEELEKQIAKRTKELAQTNIELQKMNKELQSFAYISSHDLQEPLRKIQTFSTLILEKEVANLSENGKHNFNRMQNAAKRMQTLIQDLLAYSRTSITEHTFETIDLNQIIDEVKEDLKEELMDKHATLEADGLCDVNIIPFQFRQLMLNLIGNALKFSRSDNPPYIKIKSEIATGAALNNEKLLPQKKYCHISVSDNGIGFEQEYSEKIFEVFQRLHGKNEYMGTGIGLSIVKKIVENHDGIITAKSELTKGATFDIYIPSI